MSEKTKIIQNAIQRLKKEIKYRTKNLEDLITELNKEKAKEDLGEKNIILKNIQQGIEESKNAKAECETTLEKYKSELSKMEVSQSQINKKL